MKLTKENLRKFYNESWLDFDFIDLEDLTRELMDDNQIDFWFEITEFDFNISAFASMTVGNGKFSFPVLIESEVELNEGMSFDEVFDTLEQLQKRFINLTK